MRSRFPRTVQPPRPGLPGLLRLVCFLLVSSAYLVQFAIMGALRGRRIGYAWRQRQAWARCVLRILGIEVTRVGPPPNAPHALVVPNHRSYIDVPVIMNRVVATIVAKAEIGGWPVIGAGARATEVILVDRDSPDSRRAARDQIDRQLAAGCGVIVFPEGTTYEGPGVLPLRPATFAIAARQGLPIVPVAIEYERIDDAWVGDDTFLRHFLECFSKRRTRVAVCYGEPLVGDDGGALRDRAQTWLDETTRALRERWDAA